jgi:Rrf2 family protein
MHARLLSRRNQRNFFRKDKLRSRHSRRLLWSPIPSTTTHHVKLSVKSDYAARAILSLARRYHQAAATRVEELAAENGLPPNYLVQILIELKSQEIVKSLRGKEGGYLLARPPAEITLGDVLRCVHGPLFDSPALSDPKCPSELRRAWKRLQDSVESEASNINFQQLLEENSERDRMFYI